MAGIYCRHFYMLFQNSVKTDLKSVYFSKESFFFKLSNCQLTNSTFMVVAFVTGCS